MPFEKRQVRLIKKPFSFKKVKFKPGKGENFAIAQVEGKRRLVWLLVKQDKGEPVVYLNEITGLPGRKVESIGVLAEGKGFLVNEKFKSIGLGKLSLKMIEQYKRKHLHKSHNYQNYVKSRSKSFALLLLDYGYTYDSLSLIRLLNSGLVKRNTRPELLERASKHRIEFAKLSKDIQEILSNPKIPEILPLELHFQNYIEEDKNVNV